MRALLRAERLRYRRRIELWLICGAVVAFGAFGFVAGYRTDAADPEWPTAEQIRADYANGMVDFGGMTEEEIAAEIDRMVEEQLASQEQEQRFFEDNQALLLQKYDLAQSPFTMVGQGIFPMIALVFLATLLLGDEFRFGTVRTSLLAATDRRRFLAARLITFAVMIAALFAALILAGLVLSLLLRVTADVPSSTQPLDAAAGVALIGAVLLIAFTLVAFAVALTLLTRSGALPLLLLLVWALAELFILNLQVFGPDQPLAAVPQFFLTTSIRNLLDTLARESGAITYTVSGIPMEPVATPAWAMAAVIVAWGLLFVVLADRRFRRMDIVE